MLPFALDLVVRGERSATAEGLHLDMQSMTCQPIRQLGCEGVCLSAYCIKQRDHRHRIKLPAGIRFMPTLSTVVML